MYNFFNGWITILLRVNDQWMAKLAPSGAKKLKIAFHKYLLIGLLEE